MPRVRQLAGELLKCEEFAGDRFCIYQLLFLLLLLLFKIFIPIEESTTEFSQSFPGSCLSIRHHLLRLTACLFPFLSLLILPILPLLLLI